MDEMDALERMANDLEEAQTKRHRKAKNKEAFWTEAETEIQTTIMLFYSKSRTFDPNTPR